MSIENFKNIIDRMQENIKSGRYDFEREDEKYVAGDPKHEFHFEQLGLREKVRFMFIGQSNETTANVLNQVLDSDTRLEMGLGSDPIKAVPDSLDEAIDAFDTLDPKQGQIYLASIPELLFAASIESIEFEEDEDTGLGMKF